jgi:hypothetical protein
VPSSILIATWVLWTNNRLPRRQTVKGRPTIWPPTSSDLTLIYLFFWGDMLKSLSIPSSFSSKSRWTQDYHRHAIVAIGCHDMSGSYGSERRVVSFKQTEVSELRRLHGGYIPERCHLQTEYRFDVRGTTIAAHNETRWVAIKLWQSSLILYKSHLAHFYLKSLIMKDNL